MSEFDSTLKDLAAAIVFGDDLPRQVKGLYPDYSAKTAQDIYRNNYTGNLHDALAGAYPVVRQLVGEDFFRFMAGEYIKTYPPLSANLHCYGALFADFMQGFEPAASLPYLPDMARLEWLYHEAYFADDKARLSLDALLAISQEQYPALCLEFHGDVLSSPYPLVDIWRAHQGGNDFCVEMEKGCHALVARNGVAVEITQVTTVEAEWLRRTLEGQSLGESISEILVRYPDFDLQAVLIRFSGLLTGFSLKRI